MTCHMCFSLVRTSDYRLQRASPKDGLRVAFICLRFELVRTRFFLEVDFVRRYTNSTTTNNDCFIGLALVVVVELSASFLQA